MFKGTRQASVEMNPVDRARYGEYNMGKILNKKIQAKTFLPWTDVLRLVRKCY